MKLIYYILLSLLLIILLSINLLAAPNIGGEVETKLITVRDNEETEMNLQEYLNLELFLPSYGNTTAKFEVDLYNDTQTHKLNNNLKKLYLKHCFDRFDLTVGRQPISWSFGSLLNPADFNLGAEVMSEETAAKNLDAIEVYLPFDWDTGLTVVTSFPEAGETKYGIRYRTAVSDYDVTLNYIQESVSSVGLIERRLNLTSKGDLGPIGIYGAVNYLITPKESVYLIGGDYSFYPNEINKVVIQLEYLRDRAGVLPYMLGSALPLISTQNTESDILIGNLNYTINDFSNFGLIVGYNLEDSSMIVSPEYHNQLSADLDLTVSAFISDLPSGIVEVSLSYPF